MKGWCAQVIEATAGLRNQTGQVKCHGPANLSLRKKAWTAQGKELPSARPPCDEPFWLTKPFG